ncbi:hypothetical protein BH20GEM2_BH20GEM2_16080 [soil metagenome]
MPRVLVVDDQRIPRVTLAAILGEAGHAVVTEGTGLEGIARARVWSPDVIVLDVHMPEMDGFQVVERLKRDPETAATPVIFLTAEPPTDDLIVRGLDLGAYDFLSKGCSKAELLARVGVMARIKRGNDELSAVARISDTLIRSLDPRDLSRLFVEQTCEVFRADAALFVRPQPEGMPPLRMGDGIDLTEPLSDRLIETLLNRLGEQASESDVIPPEQIPGPAGAIIRRYGFRSAIATRVEHDGHSPTLLAVFTERKDGFRRESDAPLLHLLARQATIALDNALLHVQTRQQAKKMEEQAEALEQAISQRSRFFASMSHELRTPINAVLGFSDLLREGTYGPLTEKQSAAVDKVSRSARQLLELINDILDISKIEAGKFEVFREWTDLAALVRDTVTSVELQAGEKGLEMQVETPGELLVDTDPARVRQVVLNLLSNAVKYTDEGRVHIALLPNANGGDPGGWIEIRVTDTGPGIAPEDRDRVFEEFEQAEGASSRGGTGLGLAISRKLAALLGGELRLESEVGTGSTFTLRLPASPQVA